MKLNKIIFLTDEEKRELVGGNVTEDVTEAPTEDVTEAPGATGKSGIYCASKSGTYC